MDGPLTVLLELGDDTRLRVLASVIAGRKNVSSVVSELGLSQPQVSYHLRKLKEAGLVVEEKDGRRVWYQANRAADELHIRELIDYVTRWSGGSAGTVGAGARGGRGGAPRGSGDDGDRPAVVRPAHRKDDLEDFLL